MRKYFTNITPFFVLTFIGLVLCIGETIILFLSKDQGELATGILIGFAVILYIVLLIDRLLVRKIKLKRLIIFEFISILILPAVFMYFGKTTKIRVETLEEYFIVVYNDKGLKKEKVPSSGLFNRGMTIQNQKVINLHSSLLDDNEIIILTPKTWKNGHSNIYFDTIINAEKVNYQIYYHSLSKEIADSILEKTCHRK